MKINVNHSLKKLNTFGLDVKAKLFVEVYSEEDLKEILSSQKLKNEPKIILGGGSNVLFSKNYNGLVIKNSIAGINIVEESQDYALVEAGAGVNWNKLVQYCVGKNFGGIENLSLIPGSVGAAPVQNIGAYGQELKDVFHELKGVFINELNERYIKKDECQFGYRSSIFRNELKNNFIITKVTLKLSKNPALNFNYGTVKNEVEKLGLKSYSVQDVGKVICKIRQSKLPDPSKIGNAGSFFKNPKIPLIKFNILKRKFPDIIGYQISEDTVKISAGRLIENAGLKGIRKGNVGTYSKQALVLVNYGGAEGEEIIRFADYIKEKILNLYGIELMEEVNII